MVSSLCNDISNLEFEIQITFKQSPMPKYHTGSLISASFHPLYVYNKTYMNSFRLVVFFSNFTTKQSNVIQV